MAEIPFEALAVALEGASTRGTAITNPTHYLNMAGMITPQQEKYRPDESRGTLAAVYRSKTTRRWAEWEGEGPLDVRTLPVLLSSCVANTPSPSTTASGVYLWTFTRTMTADSIRSMTGWWGDPNVQIFRGAYGFTDELVIAADVTGTDGATQSASGRLQFPSKVSAPTYPSFLTPPLIAPADMSLHLDTSSGIGSTAITGRVLSAELTIPSGVTYKWVATGAGGGLNYTLTGREKTSPVCKLIFEVPDTDEYDMYADSSGDTVIKARVRLNGPLIDGSNYYYVEWDIYGPFDAFSWGENEGSNRTIEMEITGEYQSGISSDLIVRVQNNVNSL